MRHVNAGKARPARARRCVLFALLCAASAFASAVQGNADQRRMVKVVTSFPSSFYKPFQKAFESANPTWRLEIRNMKTTAAVALLKDRPSEPIDVFWASAPDAFEVLKAADRFIPIASRATGAPARIGKYPINDPAGTYLGFALGGYGLLWNESYLSKRGLKRPNDWQDLTHPEYFHHLGICSPSRSGTTHLMVEMVLQREGWEKGWATWNEIAGNLATVTARSFGVIDGVEKGRFGIGITIDFLGQSARLADADVNFAYPPGNVFLPANVAILRGAANLAGAQAFVDFILSRAGQQLLLRPDIHRLPVRADLYAGAQPDYPNPYQAASAAHDPFLFNPRLSGARYELVNLLFDELITFHRRELNQLWSTIHAAEAMLRRRENLQAARLLAAARASAVAVPVSAKMASDARFTSDLRRSPPGVPVSPRQTQLVAQWRQFSQKQLDHALQQANQALALLKNDAPAGPERAAQAGRAAPGSTRWP